MGAMEARDIRFKKEAELRAALNARLAGNPTATAVLEALESELDNLRDEEVKAREIVGFGKATPTTIRTSLELFLPPDDRELELPVSRIRPRGSSGKPQDGDYVPPTWNDGRLESIFTLALLSLVTTVLWQVAGL